MKKFIIHKKDSDRMLPQIDAVVVEPIYDEVPYHSLRKTTLKILEDNKGEDVLIFEDDVLFTENWNEEELIRIANKYRGQIDYINTGVLLKPSSIVRDFKDGYKWVNFYGGSQGVYYLSSALDKLKASHQTHIDRMLHLKTFGICLHPFMTIQKNYENRLFPYKDNLEELFKQSEKDQRWN